MKEYFSEKADKFLKEVLEVPPTIEELEANFPHREGCSHSLPLKQIEKEELLESGGHVFGGGWASLPFVRVARKYLECDECHVQRTFTE